MVATPRTPGRAQPPPASDASPPPPREGQSATEYAADVRGWRSPRWRLVDEYYLTSRMGELAWTQLPHLGEDLRFLIVLESPRGRLEAMRAEQALVPTSGAPQWQTSDARAFDFEPGTSTARLSVFLSAWDLRRVRAQRDWRTMIGFRDATQGSLAHPIRVFVWARQ